MGAVKLFEFSSFAPAGAFSGGLAAGVVVGGVVGAGAEPTFFSVVFSFTVSSIAASLSFSLVKVSPALLWACSSQSSHSASFTFSTRGAAAGIAPGSTPLIRSTGRGSFASFFSAAGSGSGSGARARACASSFADSSPRLPTRPM